MTLSFDTARCNGRREITKGGELHDCPLKGACRRFTERGTDSSRVVWMDPEPGPLETCEHQIPTTEPKSGGGGHERIRRGPK